MLIFSFDFGVHFQFVPRGQTVNQIILPDRFTASTRNEPWERSWFLHHDTGPAHAALSVRKFLAKNNTPVVPRPSTAPISLSATDFFLSPKMKVSLKKPQFKSVEEIQEKMLQQLTPMSSKSYMECCEKWKRRWNRYINTGGAYFAGDNVQNSVTGTYCFI
jgi:hypothetical protein